MSESFDLRETLCLSRISDNDRKYYSLERARAVLGYEPRDNSAEHE